MWPRDLIKGFANTLIEMSDKGEVFSVFSVLRDREGQYRIAEVCCSLNDQELGDAVYDMAFKAKACRSIKPHYDGGPPRIPHLSEPYWREDEADE